MPKIIPELRESLVAAARSRLLSDTAHDLTVRQIAADCGTAVGTVYNYFPSKELLMAAVMLEDWQAAYASLLSGTAGAQSFEEGVRTIDAGLRGFITLYAPAWRHYAGGSHAADGSGAYHAMLISQLMALIGPLLARFSPGIFGSEAEVLAEMLLAAAQREPGSLEKLLPVIQKIIK